jgi:YggT family protein
LRSLLATLVQLYLFAIIGRMILSWFPISPGSLMATVSSFLFRITEPVLGPIRRVIPPVRFGAMGIDLAPIILIFGIQLFILPALL